SFPPRVRPLPGRTNIVITRNDDFAAEGAVRARSLPEALQTARERAHAPAGARGDGSPTIWVIGGGGIYREAIAAADLLVVTEIDLDVDGDATAPSIPGIFQETAADPGTGWHESSSGLRHRLRRYQRAPHLGPRPGAVAPDPLTSSELDVSSCSHHPHPTGRCP